MVGIFPNDAAITRLVGSQLLEQQEEWQMERRRFLSEATIAKIPEPEETLELMNGDQAGAVASSQLLNHTSDTPLLLITLRSPSWQFSD